MLLCTIVHLYLTSFNLYLYPYFFFIFNHSCEKKNCPALIMFFYDKNDCRYAHAVMNIYYWLHARNWSGIVIDKWHPYPLHPEKSKLSIRLDHSPQPPHALFCISTWTNYYPISHVAFFSCSYKYTCVSCHQMSTVWKRPVITHSPDEWNISFRCIWQCI